MVCRTSFLRKKAMNLSDNKDITQSSNLQENQQITDIDLVWGMEGTSKSDGYGLAKLVKYHPEVLVNLQEILSEML